MRVRARLKGRSHRLALVGRPAQAMRHGLVEHDQLTGRQAVAQAGMRHHEFHLGGVQRQQPEQAARPMPADIVVEAGTTGRQVVDPVRHAAPVVRQRIAQHAGAAQGGGDGAGQVGHAGCGGSQAGQRGGGVVDVREGLERDARIAGGGQAGQRGGIEAAQAQHMHPAKGRARVQRMRGLVAAHREGPEVLGHAVLVGGDDAVVGVGRHPAIVVILRPAAAPANGG